MSGSRASLTLLCFAGVIVVLAGGCTNPGSNARCVFESGGVASGRCLTQCESQCSLQAAAGCAPVDCVGACEKGASSLTNACADARYAHWRCLRRAGLPRVACSGGEPSFEASPRSCQAELGEERAACASVDAGERTNRDIGSDSGG
jgi:hypothetical protein